MVEITILALTRLSDGVCVAGITNDGRWIRPTRPNPSGWRQLEYSDCKDANAHWVVRKGNVVRMDIVKPIPEEQHSEDWLVGSRKPELVKKLSEKEYLRTCNQIADTSTAPIDNPNAARSLALVHPEKVISFSFGIETDWEGEKKYRPRCTFRLGKRVYTNKGITDAEWRGYGRKYLQNGSSYQRLQFSAIFADTGTNDCWFTLGANRVKSTDYLLVIGIHLFPVRHFQMDFKR
jgi:hypothetical protein